MAFNKPWSRDLWKLIAILALAAAFVMAALGLYAVLAFKSNLGVILEGAPVCLKGARDYDSIAAAQAVGRLDLVSFILTTGGILLAMFSLLGFWVIRREAMEEARDAALSEVQRVIQLLELNPSNGTSYPSTGSKRKNRAKREINEKSDTPNIPNPSDVSTSGAVREIPGGSNADT